MLRSDLLPGAAPPARGKSRPPDPGTRARRRTGAEPCATKHRGRAGSPSRTDPQIRSPGFPRLSGTPARPPGDPTGCGGGFPDVSPGTSPQVFEAPGAVTAGVQASGDPQSEQAQLLAAPGILQAGREAPLGQQLEKTPVVKTPAVPKQDLTLLPRVLQQLGQEERRLAPLPIENAAPGHGDVPAPLEDAGSYSSSLPCLPCRIASTGAEARTAGGTGGQGPAGGSQAFKCRSNREDAASGDRNRSSSNSFRGWIFTNASCLATESHRLTPRF